MLVKYDDPSVVANAATLGGKGYGLWWMKQQGLPVPPAMIIPTDVCVRYMKAPKGVMKEITAEVNGMLKWFKEQVGYQPLLSIRSGARVSMPGMMDTILNVGLDITTQENWISRVGKECYENSLHRLVTMYGSVVKGLDRKELEEAGVAGAFELYSRKTSEPFPHTKYQIIGAIEAVMQSWNNDRAKYYRKMNNIPEGWGTAVVIQAMVFGNLNDKSATGVLFTRNPDNGANKITGEFLVNAQGEDVVAGIRTPMPLAELASWNNEVSEELATVVEKLEKERRDVQDVEFTIQDGKLYILQTRNAKRSSKAAIRIALDMVKEELITVQEAVKRVTAKDLDMVQMNVVDPKFTNDPSFTGMGACSGIVSGLAVFSSQDAIDCKVPCILVTQETTPDDIAGMDAAVGVVTMTGGATSHAAVVARGMNKPCVVGLGAYMETIVAYKEEGGDNAIVSIDGETGKVWLTEVPVLVGSQNGDVKEFKAMVIDALGIVPVVTNPTEKMKEMLLDLSSEVDLAVAILKVKKAIQLVDHLYVDTKRDNLPEASLSFERMFGGTLDEQALVTAIEEVMEGKDKTHLTMLVSKGISTGLLQTLSMMDDLKKLILATGDMVLDGGKMDEATMKVVEWKMKEGMKFVSVGAFMHDTKCILSIEQAMQL